MARRRRPSIRDIAARAGVDASTVSLALNGSPKVAQTTRERIEAIAREINYRPNIIAQALKGGRTRSMGVVVASLDIPFFVDLLKAQERWLYQHGYTALLSVLHGLPGEQANIVEDLQTRLVDGICVGFADEAALDAYRSVAARGLPLAFYCEACYHEIFTDLPANIALCDLGEGMQSLVGCLRDLGHSRIAYVGYVEPRDEEFRAAMVEHGLPVREEWLLDPSGDDTRLGQIAASFAAMSAPPTAVIVQSDEVASRLVRTLLAQGVRVPEQMSVVGINNSSYAVSAPVPLTTLALPVTDMGEWMASCLVDQVENRDRKPVTREFRAEVVVRASTAPLPAVPA